MHSAMSLRVAAPEAPLLEVLLVVLLGAPERLRGLDRGGDRLPEAAALLEVLLALPGDRLLLGRVEEDDRAVLLAEIGALAVELGGVVVLPEDAEEVLVLHLRGVEVHLDDL